METLETAFEDFLNQGINVTLANWSKWNDHPMKFDMMTINQLLTAAAICSGFSVVFEDVELFGKYRDFVIEKLEKGGHRWINTITLGLNR